MLSDSIFGGIFGWELVRNGHLFKEDIEDILHGQDSDHFN